MPRLRSLASQPEQGLRYTSLKCLYKQIKDLDYQQKELAVPQNFLESEDQIEQLLFRPRELKLSSKTLHSKADLAQAMCIWSKCHRRKTQLSARQP